MTRRPTSILVIESRFYEDIADALAEGAIAELERCEVAYERISVPGSLEIPLAFSLAVSNGFIGRAGRHRGCVALGCVIRGETSHYDIVAEQSAAGLMRVALDHAVPVGNGILTVETREQALVRARVSEGNKGAHAVKACCALMTLEKKFSTAGNR